jgi:hypothetical protein
MTTTGERRATRVALVIGAAAVVAVRGVGAGGAGAATASYQFEARDSGALSGRVFAAAAGGADGDAVVLYGGEVPGDGDDSFADTWVYRPSTGWVAQCGSSVDGATDACGPGPRSGGAMAIGPTGTVLFGGGPNGIDGGGGPDVSTDTWVWNDGAWTQVCAPRACGPDGRLFPGMAGNGEQVVMFGGLNGSGINDDTWVFDGTTWTQTCGNGMPLACGPMGTMGAAIGWDGTQFVMFGGSPMGASDVDPPVDDTWTFDGTKWEQVCGASSGQACGPAARALASIAYQQQSDPVLQGAVMSGGGDLFTGGTQVLQRDAWIWRAGAWTQLATPWPETPVTFTDAEQPANGSGPLLALVAARPTQCQVLLVGQDPVSSGAEFALEPQTFSGGWDLASAGVPSSCTTSPAGIPATGPSAAPVGETSPTTVQIARTGRGSDRLAVIGAVSVLAGAMAVGWSRPQRRRAETRVTA